MEKNEINKSGEGIAPRIIRQRFKGWAVIEDGSRITHSGLSKKDAETILAIINADNAAQWIK
jgi:hypothetical protein